MNTDERIALFGQELSYIQNPVIQDFVKHCLECTPEYFFHIPASSSGKYHPSYALGEGGLVRHTKAAVKIFNEMIRADMALWYNTDSSLYPLSAEEFADAGIAALILHDSFKWGNIDNADPNPDGHTVHEHPLVAANFVQQMYAYAIENQTVGKSEQMILESIRHAIASHMGKWTISKYSSAVLPAPSDWLTRMVHLADLLASRKFLEVQFE